MFAGVQKFLENRNFCILGVYRCFWLFALIVVKVEGLWPTESRIRASFWYSLRG